MADELDSVAAIGQTTQVAGATTKNFIRPSIDIVKTVQGTIEISLRAVGVVLAIIVIITAGACQGFLIEWLGSAASSTNIYIAAGWNIFISFWAMLYQIIVIVQLFLRVQILYTAKIPCHKCSLFFLLDIIAIGIAAGGYFCGALPMAVYAEQLNAYGSVAEKSKSAARATTAFSFFALFLFTAMLIYFFIARYALKWSTHGENQPEGGDTAAEK